MSRFADATHGLLFKRPVLEIAGKNIMSYILVILVGKLPSL